MKPICDSHTRIYNRSMRHVGTAPVENMGRWVANHDDIYACAAEDCPRLFDKSVGYFGGGAIRAQPTCDCSKTEHTVMCLIKAHADPALATYGCLRCGRTQEDKFARL